MGSWGTNQNWTSLIWVLQLMICLCSMNYNTIANTKFQFIVLWILWYFLLCLLIMQSVLSHIFKKYIFKNFVKNYISVLFSWEYITKEKSFPQYVEFSPVICQFRKTMITFEILPPQMFLWTRRMQFSERCRNFDQGPKIFRSKSEFFCSKFTNIFIVFWDLFPQNSSCFIIIKCLKVSRNSAIFQKFEIATKCDKARIN